jgi:putative drug exporter of the RND superfamily
MPERRWARSTSSASPRLELSETTVRNHIRAIFVSSVCSLFLFVVLFGLSMDYHVFILSRIKELHDRGESTEDAIRLAITRTAGTVTSAALIMVAVFGLFASLSLIMMQQMGFGLAVAVLMDATVVRAVLVPATMKLLGERNWYMPWWLARLPSLGPESTGGVAGGARVSR